MENFARRAKRVLESIRSTGTKRDVCANIRAFVLNSRRHFAGAH
jgi:hypothetical protein